MAEIENLQRRLENLQVGKLDEKLNEIITDGKPNGEYMTLVQKLSGKTKVAFFLEFHKTEEILAERVLKIGPNGVLQVIVKWLARYLTFCFFSDFDLCPEIFSDM